MTATQKRNHGTDTRSRGAESPSSGAPKQPPDTNSHTRRHVIVGGAFIATLAVGGIAFAGGGSSVPTVSPQADRSALGVPASVFPYREVESRGTIVSEPSPLEQTVESERPLLLDGEAFADALAEAAASADGRALLDGEDLARAIEQILAQPDLDPDADAGDTSASADGQVLPDDADAARIIEQSIAEAQSELEATSADGRVVVNAEDLARALEQISAQADLDPDADAGEAETTNVVSQDEGGPVVPNGAS